MSTQLSDETVNTLSLSSLARRREDRGGGQWTGRREPSEDRVGGGEGVRGEPGGRGQVV